MLNDKEFEKGNEELLQMIENGSFDSARAQELIGQIDEIDHPIIGLNGYNTTYMETAVDASNLEAVRFLLKNGADPNCDWNNLNICPWWDLQYNDPFNAEMDTERLEIAGLFLEYGADPNYLPEDECETLYEWVANKEYNTDYEYAFLKLLKSCGGCRRNHG